MEDKWFIFYQEPHLFLHRSWTGRPVYRLSLHTEATGTCVTETLWARDLAVQDGANPAYQAQLLDFLVSNLLLGKSKPFPKPDGAKESLQGLLQHHVSGTGYQEVLVSKEKPWWKFWS